MIPCCHRITRSRIYSSYFVIIHRICEQIIPICIVHRSHGWLRFSSLKYKRFTLFLHSHASFLFDISTEKITALNTYETPASGRATHIIDIYLLVFLHFFIFYPDAASRRRAFLEPSDKHNSPACRRLREINGDQRRSQRQPHPRTAISW